MYLTAQRVVAPRLGHTGINVYHYCHPGRAWQVPPDDVPDGDPGELERKTIEVAPGGNRVRSYIDMVAPDDASGDELVHAFEAFLERNKEQPLPWKGREGRCAFRVEMEQALASTWPSELSELLAAISRHLAR